MVAAGRLTATLLGLGLAGLLSAGCQGRLAEPAPLTVETCRGYDRGVIVEGEGTSGNSATDTFSAYNAVSDAQAGAGRTQLRVDAPLRYVVKRGDTLWEIAKRFLANPYEWPDVWYVNGKIANPHRIYPGDVLQLVNVRGRTRIIASNDLERLSPRVRELPLDAAIPTIPLDVIRNFLNGPRVVPAEALVGAPYILAFLDDHLDGVGGNGAYVKHMPAIPPYPSWQVAKREKPYLDPDNNRLLGFEMIPSANADVRLPGNPATVVLRDTRRETVLGSDLLPLEAENFEANFYPRAPTFDVGARIISVFDGLGQIGQYQIVTLNRGSCQGLEAGHVLDIYQQGRIVADPKAATRDQTDKLPPLYAGRMMVFKVAERISYALVLESVRPIHVLDIGDRPQPSSLVRS